MLLRIALIMAPLSAIVALGYFYARHARPDLGGANKLVVDVCLPALVFVSLAGKQFVVAQQLPFLLAAAAIVVLSGVLAWPVARWAQADPRAFLPSVMFGNVGPIGIPLTLLAFGDEGLAPALLLLVLSNVLHFTLGVRIMSGRADLMGLVRSPLIVATALGLLFSSMQWTLPDWLLGALGRVGDILVPFMLISMGARLLDIPWHAWRIGGLGGVVAPLARLAVAGVLIGWLPLEPVQRGALLLFACLPPAVFNFLLADRFRRCPEAVASMVLIGHVASLLFLPIGLALALRP
jgi:malate permease and related proteins